MLDELTRTPWYDSDRGWRLSVYCVRSDTNVLVCVDENGDQWELDWEDLPSVEAGGEAWTEYHAHVLETGTDPLGEFYAGQPMREEKQRWSFEISKGICGPTVRYSRRGRGPRLVWHQLPQTIADWLGLMHWSETSKAQVRRPHLSGWDSWEEFIEAVRTDDQTTITSTRRGVTRITALIAVDVPRSANTIAKELRAEARKTLRR